MPQHPVDPDALPQGADPLPANPTRLPVEPEFGAALVPAEPEDPGVKPPHI